MNLTVKKIRKFDHFCSSYREN